MPTYDYTIGAGAIFHQCPSTVWVPIDVDATAVIASDTTLTTNTTITAADIIQIYDIPAGTVLTGRGVLETITAGEAGNTADIGLAGGQELFTGVALDSAAGTMTMNLVTDGWGADTLQGVTFAATDTLDMEFIADEDQGRWVVWVEMANLSKEGQVYGY